MIIEGEGSGGILDGYWRDTGGILDGHWLKFEISSRCEGFFFWSNLLRILLAMAI